MHEHPPIGSPLGSPPGWSRSPGTLRMTRKRRVVRPRLTRPLGATVTGERGGPPAGCTSCEERCLIAERPEGPHRFQRTAGRAAGRGRQQAEVLPGSSLSMSYGSFRSFVGFVACHGVALVPADCTAGGLGRSAASGRAGGAVPGAAPRLNSRLSGLPRAARHTRGRQTGQAKVQSFVVGHGWHASRPDCCQGRSARSVRIARYQDRR